MLLQNKNAIIYGAGGSMGGAVARALAGAGARMFLTGRNLSSVQKTADEILASGGNVEIDVIQGVPLVDMAADDFVRPGESAILLRAALRRLAAP